MLSHSGVDEEPVKDDRISGRGLLTVPMRRGNWPWSGLRLSGRSLNPARGGYAIDQAATKLGISRERVYFLIRLWRGGQGAVHDLAPGRSSGGRGGARLPVEVETIVREVIRKHYLTRQRKTIAAVHREIIRMCRLRGLPAPSRGAVGRSIAMLDPRTETVGRGREQHAHCNQRAGMPLRLSKCWSRYRSITLWWI